MGRYTKKEGRTADRADRQTDRQKDRETDGQNKQKEVDKNTRAHRVYSTCHDFMHVLK